MGRRFNTRKYDIDFEIDDDTFKLRDVIPAGVLFEFANLQSRMAEAQANPNMTVGDVLLDAFSKILVPESFEVFNARFFGVSTNAIDFATFQEVTEYILSEVTGKGPSPTSSSSTDG